MNDLISVIIPVYKVEKYLNKCMDSILAQTYQNLEIILVDDGSPDNCPAICDGYALKDERIKVIHQKNSGLSEARNTGIKAAAGKYIGFVDSDDYIANDMYEKLLELIESTVADLAICNYQYVDADGDGLFRISPIKNEILHKEDMFSKLEEDGSWYYVTAWNKLYKRELFENIAFPKGKLHEDEFVVHEIFYECNKIATTQNTYYYYVQRAGSIMSAKMSAKRLDAVEALHGRYLFYKGHEELHKFLPHLGRRMWETYVHITSDLAVHGSAERRRLREAKRMFRQVYNGTSEHGFSRKDHVKYHFPELCVLLIKIRKALRPGTKLRLLKGLIKVFTKGRKSDYILLDTPEHGNLGDHAIVAAQRQMMEEICGNTGCCELTANEINLQEEFFARWIPERKTILVPGGGFLGDLWPEEEFRIHRILKAFKDHKIIVFPQTVSYNLNTVNGREFLKQSQAVYSQHKDLTVFVREQKSHGFVKEYFPTVKTFLVPDIVLSYRHGIKNSIRHGVLTCFREDREKSLGAEETDHILLCLRERFSEKDIKSTTTVVPYMVKPARREAELQKKLGEFAGAKLIVTDRLHGMVFAAVTGTPCIAAGNSNGKVKGVYQWIKELKYVKYMEDISEFKGLFMELDLGQDYSYQYNAIEEKNAVMRKYLYEMNGRGERK